jgi:hypothetical protein
MKQRQLLTAMMTAVLLPLAAAPASAAPPGNDEPQGAIALHLGDRVEQDTTEATTTAQDAALNQNCGAPATNASVWYSYSPDQDRNVVLDMTASDYSGGMLVFRGNPTVDSLVTCGQGQVGLRARAGKRYSIMVISDTDVMGGQLSLSLKKAPPPPRVHVSLAGRGVAYRGGAARLHGTYSCKHGTSAFLDVRLLQRAGRLKIGAERGREIRCNGSRRHWSVRLVSPTGTYARGPAVAHARIDACGAFSCRHATARRHVHLAWAAGSHRQQRVQPPTTGTPRPRVERPGHWSGG